MSIIVCRSLRDIPSGWYLGDCAVSGGTMEDYLKKALKYSDGKLCIRLKSFTMLFPLPCPSGKGQIPSRIEADRLISSHRSRFSRTLMTNYLTFRKDDGLFCLLFDTTESLTEKATLLKQLNIPMVLVEDPKLLPLIQR